MKTFAWKILHGRVKARPSGQNAPVTRRLEERRKKHDPLEGVEWRRMKTEDRAAGSPLPWKIKLTRKPKIPGRGETEDWEKVKGIGEKEIAIFTDGSLKDGKTGYGIAAYTEQSLRKGKTEWVEAGNMTEKSVLDAETWAIIRALQLTKQDTRDVRIYTDSRNARDWIVEPRKEGPTAYMWDLLCEATEERKNRVTVSWIKGHAGNKGNEKADALARKGGEIRDPWKGKSHAASAHEISEARNAEWMKWFREREHFYKRKPRRKLKHQRGLTRSDTIMIFRIRSDKGWGHTVIIRKKTVHLEVDTFIWWSSLRPGRTGRLVNTLCV